MGTTKKILRKVAVKLEAVYGTYLAPDILLPLLSGLPKQTWQNIEDESIVGVAFKDLSLQGTRAIEGSHEIVADKNTLPFILEQATGSAVSSTTYTPATTSNAKSFALCMLDGVKTNKYSGLVMNNVRFTSEAENKVKVAFDLLSPKVETRDDTAFPTIATYPSTEFLHQHLTGTGYFRIGDQADALAAGDNITNLKKFECSINWNHAIDPVNAQEQLSSQSAMCDVTLSMQIAEHTADTWHAARDARTPLQLQAYWYASATAAFTIMIPNFIITDVAVSEDDKGRVDLTCAVGRNGLGTAYSNANMAFNTPIKFGLVNA